MHQKLQKLKTTLQTLNYEKILTILYACLLVVTGIVCILTGFIADSIHERIRIFTTYNLLVVSYIISIAGVFTLAAAVLCFWASQQRYQWQIVTIGLLIGMSIIMELSAGISGASFNVHTSDIVAERMHKSMKFYGEDGHKNVNHAWDRIQRKYECCGVDSFQDWNAVNQTLPNSCCESSKRGKGKKCKTHMTYGCRPKVSHIISEQTAHACKTGILSAVLQFMGLCIFMLCKTLIDRMDRKERLKDGLLIKNKAEIFTVEPFYSKMEK